MSLEIFGSDPWHPYPKKTPLSSQGKTSPAPMFSSTDEFLAWDITEGENLGWNEADEPIPLTPEERLKIIGMTF